MKLEQLEQLEQIPVAVREVAASLGIRIDGIWEATKKTPASLNCTPLRPSPLDKSGCAVGASFNVTLPGISARTLVVRYVETVTKFSPAECPCRKAHEALDRATYVAA